VRRPLLDETTERIPSSIQVTLGFQDFQAAKQDGVSRYSVFGNDILDSGLALV
jgi:hypothetical protein